MTGVFETLMQLDDGNGPDVFVGPAAPEGGERMFGGQFLAQALMAAGATVDDERAPHSLHAYFLRAGDVDQPIELHVEHIGEGRSFSRRSVVAIQDGRECFRMMTSFHGPESGFEFPAAVPPEVPPAESVTLTYNEFSHDLRTLAADRWEGEGRPMDIRYINPPTAAEGEPILDHQLMWMRINEELPDDTLLHAAGLAYLADSTLVDHVMLPHGLRWQDARLTGTSLDHAMWFHRPARADRWMLYDQWVEATGSARGLAGGRLVTTDGHLVATCGQEGLMRWVG
ncbi:MAG: acyl-CoA thioesterase II [Actinomycetia bacterium]|nr:acyl-CoA thioesterase II [Actinomycetes bacterium]